MQLLAQGACQHTELVVHLLRVLLPALNSQASRMAVHTHADGMAALLQIAVGVPTPSWAATLGASAGASAGGDGDASPAAAAAAAVELLVQLGQERQIKPQLAKPLAEVLLQGSEARSVSAAWIVSRLAKAPSEADKAAARSAQEFCQVLAASGAVAAAMEHLLSRDEQRQAAVPVLLAALKVREEGVRLPAAAALGHLLRRPDAVQDRLTAVAAQATTELLDVLRSTPAPTAAAASAAAVPAAEWTWMDTAAGLAALGAQHSTACSDLARGLRQMLLRGGPKDAQMLLRGGPKDAQMLLRGGPKDAGAAAHVAALLAASARGRAALLAEALLPGLVGVVGNPSCAAAARAAAAAAVGALAVPGSVALDDGLTGGTHGSGAQASAVGRAKAVHGSAAAGSAAAARQPGARVVDPKLEAVRAGAVAALVGLLRAGAGPCAVLEAAEALAVLGGCQAGRDAALAAGATEALQEVVLAGKRKEVAEKVAAAAGHALMRLL
ncbi:hypothetical protein OEZ86_002206 [Tetradesmus obliquus]|nr:hypothetical protein OEZ86_002206 [Tetradesmus obliquus]